MLKRISADNYKCLVNFECGFDSINLILGTNGSGKSTVFELLRKIQDVVNGRSPINLFRESTLTRWQERNIQTFDLEIEGNGGLYVYHLEIEHEIGQDTQRIRAENVTYNGWPLYRADLGEIHLYRDDTSESQVLSGDWTGSSLPFLGPRSDNTKITWLKNWFKTSLMCLRIDPLHMKPMADGIYPTLDEYGLDYVAWYRHRIATDMNATIKLFNALKEMYEDFNGLILQPQGGNVEHLYARIGVHEERKGKPLFVNYSFGELSEGERALIVLYTLLQLMSDKDMTLCLDEPDNYLALAEIQPWLLNLKDVIQEHGSQSLLISHHPELINNLAPRHGLIFERLQNGPATIRRFEVESGDECLTPSEIIARGWE